MATIAFQILVSDDPAALKRSRSQRVVGPLWVTLGGRPFPRAKWDDFPLAVLASWTQKCLHLNAVGDSALLVFFEGPARLRVEVIEDDLVRLTAVENGVDSARCITSKAQLWGELTRAGHKVLAQCSKRGWPSLDWNQLKDNLEKHKHPAPRN